jgi:hypothetical protein
MKRMWYLDNLVFGHAPQTGRSWRACLAFWVVAMMLLVSAGRNARSDDAGQDTDPPTSRTLPAGFAYDPQLEEGPHPDSDFEWWYHFGFLKRKGTSRFEYSFVSSFQRNKAGRYLFYNLADLDSGEKSHHALVDRALLGLTPASERPGILGRMAHRLQDSLPLLPEGHAFLTPANLPPASCRSELRLL